MAGMMSDLMKIQEAEEARMRKLEAQMGKLGGGLGGSVGGTATGRRISPEECKRCVRGLVGWLAFSPQRFVPPYPN
jgi:hypothetical protein